ncbi:Clp protease ClpP [Bernardetia sp. Wsw4-3y2]|uniref:Clp protease ClpP n=1 Tax=Bernardetia sp. Wsw4-3y2 TaxID=3127471 RepID=UPI0030D05A90
MAKIISISGIVGSEELTEKAISRQIEGVSETERIIFKINSDGGSVYHGNSIYDYIRSLKNYTESNITGFCASMATIVACSTKVAKMSSNALYLLHAPSGYLEWANSNKLKEELIVMEKIENIMLSIYSKKTGQTPEQLRQKYFDGKDHYLTAEEAKQEGFVDEVIEDVFDIPMNIAASANKDKKTFFISQSTKQPIQVMEKPLHKIASFLKTNEEETAILAKLESDQTEKTSLLIELAKTKGFDSDKIALLEISPYEKAKEIVMKAQPIASMNNLRTVPNTDNSENGKEEQKQTLLNKTAMHDYNAFAELMKVTMENAPKPETVDKANWTMNDWETKDPKGLLEIHDTDPKRYAALAKTYVSPAKKR